MKKETISLDQPFRALSPGCGGQARLALVTRNVRDVAGTVVSVVDPFSDVSPG
jgi:hypothetical protein